MTFQPAAGTKDLNPEQVETDQLLINKLSKLYKLWGYEEVSPPIIERLSTLIAGGQIDDSDIIKIASDEPLGLRPEMTASIARTATTRLANKPRPLRIFAHGITFGRKEAAESGLFVEEQLQSGVEIFGLSEPTAEIELLKLLISSMETLSIGEEYSPKLLISHSNLLRLILKRLNIKNNTLIRKSLINYDLITLNKIDCEESAKLIKLQECRGRPDEVLNKLESIIGKNDTINELRDLFNLIEPIANEKRIEIQLDPTFQPHYEIYTGIAFQLICQGFSSPISIANGGRYDELVRRYGSSDTEPSGLGFSFRIDKVRDLVMNKRREKQLIRKFLITYKTNTSIEEAFKRQQELHEDGEIAVIELQACADRETAYKILVQRGYTDLEWIGN